MTLNVDLYYMYTHKITQKLLIQRSFVWKAIISANPKFLSFFKYC